MTISVDTPLRDLTVGDLLQLLGNQKAMPSRAYGLKGIAQIFGVSISTAKRIKASGIIDKAISQNGRTIIVNTDKALELYESATHGRTNR